MLQQDIIRLEVAVNDVPPVQVGESGQHAVDQFTGSFNRRCLAVMLPEPTGQRTIGHILANDDDLLIVNIGLNHRHDVRVSARLQPDGRFLFEGLEVNVLVAGQLQSEARGGDG